MLGVVLCGGQSTRMRSDKGLITSSDKGKMWAEIVREKFSSITVLSFLSINPSQAENYLIYFREGELVVDNPTIKVQGPMLGLLSVHLKYPDQDLMVTACDMINVDEIVLKKLIECYNSSKAEAVVFKGERVQPLCGIYSSRGLNKIYTSHLKNEMSNNSMMHALEKLETSYISIIEEWKSYFKNFNREEDLN
ncbi:MAG TPA: molybdenum cofactor guanylyltransferase [Cyclobacteriaceae bacterium]|jgi:molybdopterin-guanine dinucleotide biosynthesis protein A|nr:molybdenum cofactor guanylyltransferase [Cyclobacteriaceae bacterium]